MNTSIVQPYEGAKLRTCPIRVVAPAGTRPGSHLSTTLEGSTWYFKPDVDQNVYVSEPLDTYLGGGFGKVLIDGEVQSTLIVATTATTSP